MVLAAFKKQQTCFLCKEFISLQGMQSWQTCQCRAVISVTFSQNVLLSIQRLCFLCPLLKKKIKSKSQKGTCFLIFECRPHRLIFYFSVSHLALHADSQKKWLCKPDQFVAQLVTKSCCSMSEQGWQFIPLWHLTALCKLQNFPS